MRRYEYTTRIYHLSFSKFSKTSDSGSDGESSSSGDGVSTTSSGLLTTLTRPDTDSTSGDGSLTTESTIVFGVLLNF